MPTTGLDGAAKAIARHLETLVALERARNEKLEELIMVERDRLELAKQTVTNVMPARLGQAQR